MGTDIHLVVERRGSDGTWERVLPPTDFPRNKYEQESIARGEKYYLNVWFSARNYRLFSILAGVRNGYGYAGVAIGEEVVPIAEPRGFPLDLSHATQRLIDFEDEDDIWLGDHSHSWLTLAELQAFNWNRPVLVYGTVTLKQCAERILKHGRQYPLESGECPYEGWSGGVSGSSVVTLSFYEALPELDRGMAVPVGLSVYVRDAWYRTLRDQTQRWHEVMMPALAKLGSPENVRIIFGFDS